MTVTPSIVAPVVRDLDVLAGRLGGWLSARLPGATGLHLSGLRYPLGAGMSHETILFDATWRVDGVLRRRALVVRIKPMRDPVYRDDMFIAQYRIMRLLHDRDTVRVAEPLWLEEDPALLGAAFFVMAQVGGQVAVSYPPYSQSGWLVDTAPADRRRLWTDAVRQLAAIQTVPVAAAPFLAPPGWPAGFDQEIDRWRRYLDWIDADQRQRFLRDAFAALTAQAPANRPDGLVWGDARLGNMMIGPDHRVAAVMDWEQPSLGGALHDLAWWLRSDHVQTTGRGIAPLAGMGTRAETIALWSDVADKPVADLDWYEAFACFKMECLGVRMVAIRDLALPADRPAPGVETLRMLGAA